MSGGRAVLWASRGIFFVNGAAIGVWSGLIPIARDKHGLSLSELGASLLLMSAGALAAMPVTGLLITRLGSGALLRVIAVLFPVALSVTIIAPNYGAFAIALLLFGVLNGAMDVSMNAQALVVERHVGRPVMSAIHGFFSIGGLTGAGAASASLAVLMPDPTGLVLCIWILAIALASIAFLIRDIPQSRSKRPFIRPSREIIQLGLLAFCVFLAEGAMLDWSAALLRDEFGMTAAGAPMGYAIFAAAMAVGRLSGDALIARLSRGLVFRGSALIAGASLALGLASGSLAGIFIAFCAFGFGLANLVPILISAAGRDEADAGAAVAVVSTLAYSGFLAGPPLIGFLGEWCGLDLAMAVVAVLCLAVAVGDVDSADRGSTIDCLT